MSPEELADRALGVLGGDALVTAVRQRWTMLRFAHSRPTQLTSVDDLTVEIAALRSGHVGRASTNGTSVEQLKACMDQAVRAAEAAAAAAGRGTFPGFPPRRPPRAHGGYDPVTAQLEISRGREALEAAFETASTAGVEAGGIWTAGEVHTTIASPGAEPVSDQVTDAYMKVVAIAPCEQSGYASDSAVSVAGIDGGAIAAEAAQKARRGAGTVTLEPGEYTVVLEPHAVSELLWVLGHSAFNGLLHAEGQGALSGKLGTRVAAPAINLSDSPRFAGTLPRGIDAEGVAKAPLPLIQDGVAHAVVHDTRSATLASARSTGHALEAGGSLRGPRPTNLVLVGGGEPDVAALCAGVERGIYVTRLWYTNILRHEDTAFTAVTRDGTFLIEHGEVTSRIADMRVTDTALGMFGRTRAVGSRTRLCAEGEFYGTRFATGSVCPPLRAEGVRFTGTAGPDPAALRS